MITTWIAVMFLGLVLAAGLGLGYTLGYRDGQMGDLAQSMTQNLQAWKAGYGACDRIGLQ
jgi:hypothetical protein